MSFQPPFTPLLVPPLGLLCVLTKIPKRAARTLHKDEVRKSVWALPRPLVVQKEHEQAGGGGPCQGGALNAQPK